MDYINSLNGVSFVMDIKVIKDTDGKTWESVAHMCLGGTQDKENWAYIDMDCKAYDNDQQGAINTAVKSFFEYVASDEYHQDMKARIEALSKVESEPE